MQEYLMTVITKAMNETEKAKALIEVLENRALFDTAKDSSEDAMELKEKIAKAIYALWDSIEVIELNLDSAAEIVEKYDVR